MRKDLLAPVADIQQEKTPETLFTKRRQSLHLSEFTFDIRVHPNKDPGVYQQGAAFLSDFASQYRHALLALDREWEGAPPDRNDLEQQLLNRVRRTTWPEEDVAILVLDPELEAWFWIANSPHVARILGTDWETIRSVARSRKWWSDNAAKPSRPKEFLEALLRQQKIPQSSSLFVELAGSVSLERCHDPAFVQLRDTLRRWFPATERTQ